MVIEESIIVNAPLHKVWETFVNVARWKDWNTVLRDVSRSRTEILVEGCKLRFCLSPLHFPVGLEPLIEEIIPWNRIVWTSAKYGISARHAFSFEEVENSVLLTSRETFSGILVGTRGFLLLERKLRELTRSLLKDIKRATET